jgi:2-aminoethylphosphonate transport system substrate-binding protein
MLARGRIARLGAGTLASLALLVSSFGSASAAVHKQATANLGTIVLYTADGLESYYQTVIPVFEKEYGAKVEMVTNGSGAVVNRLILEKDHPQADVIVTLPPFVQQAESDGVLAPFITSANSEIPAISKDPNHEWESFIDNYFEFVYNPTLLKSPPTTLNDLLSPSYKGRIAYSNPTTAGDGMAFIILLDTLWGQNKAFAYLRKLQPNIKFNTTGTGVLDTYVSRGEIVLANGDLQMNVDDKMQGKMTLQPLFLSPAPGQKPVTFEDPYVIGLVHGAPNAAGGKALINFLLGKYAQLQTYSVFGVPARDDVKSNGAAAQLITKALKGVDVLNVNWNTVIADQSKWETLWTNTVAKGNG